jgi:hypothetical protein
MPQYLTPNRYRLMSLGIDLSAKSDAELGALIGSASAEVNRHCATPMGHDFRGGTVTREEHQWDVGNVHHRPTGRLWPKHGMGVMPITSCNQIDIYTTKTNYVRFTPNNIFVNGRTGYVEPIAAPITTALFTSIPPWLLSSPVAYIDYTYAREYVETDEQLYPLGGKTYQALNQFWTDAAVTVKVDGSTVAGSDYTVNRVEGSITFTAIQDASAEVTVTYTHKLDFAIAMATAIVVTDMLGYSNINASGLGGLSAIKVEEIELRQSSKAGYNNMDLHPAAKKFLGSFVYVSFA